MPHKSESKKNKERLLKWYRALCPAGLVTGNVIQVLVTDKPIPGLDKPAVLVWAQTENEQPAIFWIDVASNNADRMLRSVMTAIERNYPVIFNQGAVDPGTYLPKEAVDTVILVNPLVVNEFARFEPAF